AFDVRLPGALAGGAGQAADVEDEVLDLLLLEGLAEFLHGGLRHAVADDAGDVLVLVAVNPLVIGEVGPLAAAAGAAVAAAAQPAEQRLSFRERRLLLQGQRLLRLLRR